MARAGRIALKLLLAGALGGGAYFAWVSSIGSPATVDVLPPGAFGVVEVRGAESLASRLSGTRFAAAFSRSAGREWLERTALVRSFDSVLSEVERISGVSPGRGTAFDLVGSEAAVGWYPPAGVGAVVVPWIAGGRLSVRAWAAVTAMRLGRRLGLGAATVTREETGGCVLYSLPGRGGESLFVFLAGRVLVGGNDRSLALEAARAAGEGIPGVTREPEWQAIRGALPAKGELLVWLRQLDAIPGDWSPRGAERGSVGALLRSGATIEIDVAAGPSSSRSAAAAADTPQPLPAVGLLRQDPLLLLTSSETVPAAVSDLLQNRRSAVAQRDAGAAATGDAIRPGSGYAIVITDSAPGAGFFPAPRGFAVIGMASADESARALPLLFPRGARTGSGGGTRALTTRESFPLAGEFELWGAAVGPRLIFATDASLIDAASADAGTAAAPGPRERSWRVGTLASVSMEKVLPLLRRWNAPLSGLLTARWPGAPDITRDFDMLAAIATVRVVAGSDERLDRAAITLEVHDLR